MIDTRPSRRPHLAHAVGRAPCEPEVRELVRREV
jgi:hypothetical protein